MRRKLSEYEKLKKVWYKKLADSGFVDIESNSDRISSTHVSRFSGLKKYGEFSNEWRASKEMYYRYATSFLNEYQFETELEKTIWEYHSNGMSSRQIALTLKNVGLFKYGRMAIWRRLQKLKKTMKDMYINKKAE